VDAVDELSFTTSEDTKDFFTIYGGLGAATFPVLD